jgi:SAM-dependent methyltransferase
MGKPNSLPPSGHYSANYGNFQTELYAQIRHEAFGEDIGQNSWFTSDEQDRFLAWLELSPGKTLLDVACGAGGPALRIATTTGCSVVGIDVHEQASLTASSLAAQCGLAERAEFRSVDAAGPLPFSDASFDAITCIDAIKHFSDRPRVIKTVVLIPGGILEEHGPYLPSYTDGYADDAYTRELAKAIVCQTGLDSRPVSADSAGQRSRQHNRWKDGISWKLSRPNGDAAGDLHGLGQ